MFDESKHPRDDDGKFTYSDGAGGTHAPTEAERERLREMGVNELKDRQKRILPEKQPEVKSAEKKMTPAEKIASVHIDFDRDNILPELNEEDLVKIGVDKNKSVLLKEATIKRNFQAHGEVPLEKAEELISSALYSPTDVFRGNDEKPYYTFAKPMMISQKDGNAIYGLVLLDVEEAKNNFEIVHWHWVRARSFETLKKKKGK